MCLQDYRILYSYSALKSLYYQHVTCCVSYDKFLYPFAFPPMIYSVVQPPEIYTGFYYFFLYQRQIRNLINQGFQPKRNSRKVFVFYSRSKICVIDAGYVSPNIKKSWSKYPNANKKNIGRNEWPKCIESLAMRIHHFSLLFALAISYSLSNHLLFPAIFS